MFRSFLGLYQNNSRGKVRFAPEKRKVPRTASVPFYLLPKNTTKTPKGTDEFQLIQAGLGKRTLVINDDMDHVEVSV